MIVLRTYSDRIETEDIVPFAASAGLYVGGKSIRNRINKELTREDRDPIIRSNELEKKLMKEADSIGVKVKTVKGGIDESAYLDQKKYNKVLVKNIKKARKRFKSKKDFDAYSTELAKYINSCGLDASDLADPRNKIILGKDNPNVAAFAHELGHAELSRKGGKGNLVGRLSHKITSSGVSKKKNIAYFLNGVHSGYKKEKNKQKGKETSKLIKYKSIAIPAAAALPMLVKEGSASKMGMKLLKKHGASKDTLRKSRKLYLRALGSHITTCGSVNKKLNHPIIVGASGDLVGKGIAKLDS